jgi:hypothetical protein
MHAVTRSSNHVMVQNVADLQLHNRLMGRRGEL